MEKQLENRLKDLADKSFKQNMYTFSGFLGLSDQDVFWQIEKELRYITYELYGGYDSAERKVIRYGSIEELGYEETYPIQCIHVKPVLAKFADQLSHRDFLGALMNLGIDRSTIGDIKVGNKEGYIYCLDSISEFICIHLDKIKHTNVKCQVVTEVAELPQDIPEEIEVLVSSLRIDGCLAKIYHKSRSEIIELFRSGKVYVNGRVCENNAKILKTEEVVNLRGYGKFIFTGIKYETKKGKICADIKIYK